MYQGSNFDLMYRSVFHWLAQNQDCTLGKTKNKKALKSQLSPGGGGGLTIINLL